jgi:hypothetical protein
VFTQKHVRSSSNPDALDSHVQLRCIEHEPISVYKCFTLAPQHLSCYCRRTTSIMPSLIDAHLPPLDGSLSTVGLTDFHAANNGALPFAIFAREPFGSNVSVPVTYSQFSRATWRAAKIIGSPTTRTRPVVALLLHCDTLLYASTAVGMMRAGLVVSATDHMLFRVPLNDFSVATPHLSAELSSSGMCNIWSVLLNLIPYRLSA